MTENLTPVLRAPRIVFAVYFRHYWHSGCARKYRNARGGTTENLRQRWFTQNRDEAERIVAMLTKTTGKKWRIAEVNEDALLVHKKKKP